MIFMSDEDLIDLNCLQDYIMSVILNSALLNWTCWMSESKSLGMTNVLL